MEPHCKLIVCDRNLTVNFNKPINRKICNLIAINSVKLPCLSLRGTYVN